MKRTIQDLASELGQLVSGKQIQYGKASQKASSVLKLLYPDGIKPYQYKDVLLIARVFDKISRISQRGSDGKDLGGESPWPDLAGYGLLGWQQDLDDGETTSCEGAWAFLPLTEDELYARSTSGAPDKISLTKDELYARSTSGAQRPANDNFTTGSLAADRGWSRHKAYRELKVLLATGKAVEIGRGVYAWVGEPPKKTG